MTAIPNVALTAFLTAYSNAVDTRGNLLGHAEAARAALVAAAPHIVDANPDTGAYIRGQADGYAQAYGIVMLSPGRTPLVLDELHAHQTAHLTHQATT